MLTVWKSAVYFKKNGYCYRQLKNNRDICTENREVAAESGIASHSQDN